MIEGYQLESRLASGLRGDLFRATRADCGLQCLVRILNSDAETSRKFLDEASLAASLFHPNLAEVYESGSLPEGDIFVVIEDTAGFETLRDRLDREGVPDLLDGIRIVRETAEAVHALHQSGVVHRALSPENVLVTADASGELAIRLQNIDLGGADQRAIIGNKFLIDTETAAIRYFAPEQCAGEMGDVRTDVYSLGILLYELIAGTLPFDADRASGVIDQHRNSRPPEIKIDNFELRMLITHTLMESLGKRGDIRQASADLFARQLRHIEQLANHVSTPPPAVSVAIPAPRQQPRLVIPDIDSVLDVPDLEETVTVIREASTAVPFPSSDEPLIDPDKILGRETGVSSEASSPVSLPPAIVAAGSQRSSRLSRLKTRHRQTSNSSEAAVGQPISVRGSDEPDAIRPSDFRAPREEVVPKDSSTAQKRMAKFVEWNEPLDDIPSVDEALEVLRSENGIDGFEPLPAITETPSVTKAQEIEPAIQTPEFFREAKGQETLGQIRIPDPDSFTGWNIGLEFSPTILGDVGDEQPPRSASRDEMFSSIERVSPTRFPRTRRFVAVGAVACLAMMGFVFRGEIADAVEPFDLGTLHSPPAHVDARLAPVTVYPESDVVHSATKPTLQKTAVSDAEEEPKAIRINLPSSTREEKERPIAAKIAEPSASRERTQNARSPATPIEPSTVVITYGDRSKKPVEPARRRDHRDPFAKPVGERGLTRPRIVTNPQP